MLWTAIGSLFQINPEAVKYWDLDPDELEMMEDDKVYPPRFEVLVCGSHARELITALICFRGMAELGSNTTELVLEPMAAGLLGGLWPSCCCSWEILCSLDAGAAAVTMRQPPFHMDHHHHFGLMSQSRSAPTISQEPGLFPYRYPYEV